MLALVVVRREPRTRPVQTPVIRACARRANLAIGGAGCFLDVGQTTVESAPIWLTQRVAVGIRDDCVVLYAAAPPISRTGS
jgi:hypothetical protein